MQLPPVRQAELHSDLKIQEKDELQWKKTKADGMDENGEREAKLRRGFNGERERERKGWRGLGGERGQSTNAASMVRERDGGGGGMDGGRERGMEGER